MTRNRLHKYFKCKIIDELKRYVTQYDILKPNYYLIIGACIPIDNLLLKFKDASFPKKLDRLLNSDYKIHYILKEKDIKIDLVLFNQVMSDIFNEFFSKDVLGKKYRNVMFIRHNKLDCYSMYKTLKYLYGKSNCINLYDNFIDKRSPIVAINELIDKYVNNKVAMNRSDDFKTYVNEIKQYINQRLDNING